MKDLKILENGDYQLPDGRIVSKEEIGKLYEKDRKEKSESELELQEGECSGPIQLNG